MLSRGEKALWFVPAERRLVYLLLSRRRCRMRLAISFAFAIAALSSAPPAVPATAARFESRPCPANPAPVAAVNNARCGYLTVPENRSKPNGRTIRLPVAIIPAATAKPAPDPIVWMTGGPGFDAFTQAKFVVDWGLNRDRNVILMSQRGTSSSSPSLTCAGLDRFTAKSVGMVYDGPSTARLHAQAVAACRRSFAARGIDLSAYNTRESAADYDDLRTALGLVKWNVWGMSYGTDLALTYMRLYPKGIRAAGIDGIVPPDVAGGVFVWKSAREGINAVFQACAAQPACNRRYPNLSKTFTRLVRQLEAKPIVTAVKLSETGTPIKVVIDGGVLVNWMFPATHAAASLPESLDQLAHGRVARIAEQWAARQVGDPKDYGTYGWGLFFTVACSEWVPFESAADVVAAGRNAFPAFPDSVLAQPPQLPYLAQDCRVWGVPRAPTSVREPTRSAIPTLVVSATFDAQSGAQWGAHAARTLSKATVITVAGVSHMAVAASSCAQSVITSFFDRPLAPNVTCVGNPKPISFKIAPPI
jgi:pimeloyl-ACP methyl ester carboxylesterase